MKEKIIKLWKKKDHPITIMVNYILIFVFLMVVQPILNHYLEFGGNELTHFISILIVTSITSLFIVKRYRDKVDDKIIIEE